VHPRAVALHARQRPPRASGYPRCRYCRHRQLTARGFNVSSPVLHAQFFGFSDPITQKLIESLPGYQTWEEVMAEREANRDPDAPPTPPRTREPPAWVKEFREKQGNARGRKGKGRRR